MPARNTSLAEAYWPIPKLPVIAANGDVVAMTWGKLTRLTRHGDYLPSMTKESNRLVGMASIASLPRTMLPRNPFFKETGFLPPVFLPTDYSSNRRW